MDPDGEIVLCNCIRMLPMYSDDDSSCKFTVEQGRVLIFKTRGEWKMKHKLGHKYETMWYTASEWSNVDDVMNLFKPDPLDIDVYYLLYKDELSATLTVNDRFADFHQYVTEILEAGVKMMCMMNTNVHGSKSSKRSKKSKDFHMSEDVFENISRIRKNDTENKNIINNDINKNIDNFIDPCKSISKRWTWDEITVGKKRIPI